MNIKKAGVIGDPISHSLSPIIHNYLLKKYNISGEYSPHLIKAEKLETECRKFALNNYKGFNVTLPHKENMFQICDYLSKTASEVKAVNTVIITEDKKLFGHNSDGEGFTKNILQNITNFQFKNKKILIIGAGGATRAILFALLKENVKEIVISNRNLIKAQSLINDFKDKFPNCHLQAITFDEKEKFLANCDLLINCTSLGMKNQPDLEIDLTNLNKKAIVTDIVYNPLITNLLKQAKNQGNQIVTGIGMLVYQALIGFEAWYGQKPEIDEELFDLLQNHFK